MSRLFGVEIDRQSIRPNNRKLESEPGLIPGRRDAKKLVCGVCVGLAGLVAWPGGASAQPTDAYTNAPAYLYAGPGGDYPVVSELPADLPVTVMGCISGYTWCDVALPDLRGWIYAAYLNYPWQGSSVPILSYGTVIGLPIIGFSIGSYWGNYYRNRPWYHDQARWANHPPPPPGPPRAPYGAGYPPGQGGGNYRPPERPPGYGGGHPGGPPPGQGDLGSRPPGPPQGHGGEGARPPGPPPGQGGMGGRPPGPPQGYEGGGGRPPGQQQGHGGGERPSGPPQGNAEGGGHPSGQQQAHGGGGGGGGQGGGGGNRPPGQ